MGQLKITLKKSPIGVLPKHKKTIAALGLRKVNQSVVKQDNEAMRGMIHQIGYLLQVENI